MPSKIPDGETRGWIVPIGGAENKENDRQILERFVRVSGGAEANIVVDDIIQNVMDDNTANISFTVEHGDLHEIKPIVDKLVKELGGRTTPIYHDGLAKVSAVGVGMKVHTGVAQRMFKALADGKINIQNITTSEIKISCIIDQENAPKAQQIVHDAFDLSAA